MNNSIPRELHRLPAPWGDLKQRPQHWGISAVPSRYVEAVDVLRRCLKALVTIPRVDDEQLPVDLVEYWSFFSSIIADEIPTFDEFRIGPFQQYMGRHHPQQPLETVCLVAAAWLASTTSRLAYQALFWLGEQMSKTPHQPTIDAMCDLAEKYWQVDERIRYPLLMNCEDLAPARARPIFEQILSQPDIDRELREELEDRLKIMQIRVEEQRVQAAIATATPRVEVSADPGTHPESTTRPESGHDLSVQSGGDPAPPRETTNSHRPSDPGSSKSTKKRP